MKTLPLSIVALAVAVVGCGRALPSGVTQQGGNAPLILDLDAAVGSQSTNGGLVIGKELQFTVRGANKGHGEVGGATATFNGNGDTMCVILDPENAWTVITPTDNGNLNSDNGDSDLYVGMTSDYTGAPGTRIGDFNGVYTDPLGVTHPLDNNLCIQIDLFGNSGAHAGAGEPEFCSIQTTLGTSYTILAKTFSVPSNDDLLTEDLRVDDDPGGAECGPPDGSAPGPVNELTLKGDDNLNGDPGVPAGYNAPPKYLP